MKPVCINVFCLVLAAILSNGGDSWSAGPSDPAFDASKYFPRRPGEIFTYRTTALDRETIKIRTNIVGHPTTVKGISEQVVPETEINEDEEVQAITYYTSDAVHGFRTHGEFEADVKCLELFSPAFSIPQGMKLGETIKQTVKMTVVGESEECHTTTQVDFETTFESIEPVKVLMGRFEGCAKISIREVWKEANGKTINTDRKTLFFAPDIGLVLWYDDEVGDAERETAVLVSISKPDGGRKGRIGQ